MRLWESVKEFSAHIHRDPEDWPMSGRYIDNGIYNVELRELPPSKSDGSTMRRWLDSVAAHEQDVEEGGGGAMSSEQREALVERMAAAITHQYKWGTIGSHRSFAEAALASVEAAGGWPPPEAVTAEDIHQALGRVQSTPSIDWLRDYITREILATLRSRGITAEGAE